MPCAWSSPRRQPARRPDNAIVLVTHYQRLLNYIVPDYVHVMDGGRIVRTGGKELALELETRLRLGRGRARGRVEGDRVSATRILAGLSGKACLPAATLPKAHGVAQQLRAEAVDGSAC